MRGHRYSSHYPQGVGILSSQNYNLFEGRIVFCFLYFHAPNNGGLYMVFNSYFSQADLLKMKRLGFELDFLAPCSGEGAKAG